MICPPRPVSIIGNTMPDKIWNFRDVIAEVLESRGLKMLRFSRVIARAGVPKDHFVSNQEYLLLLQDKSGQESRVVLLIDDESTNGLVRSELEHGLDEQ